MAYLIAILVSIALFAGFLILTTIEDRRGSRVLARARSSFDREAGRIEFIFTHVDFASALRALAVSAFERVAHDVAHGILIATRSLERLLTRAVRTLRTRRAAHGDPLPAAAEELADGAHPHPTAFDRGVRALRMHLRRHPRTPAPVAPAPLDAVE